jgi:hypothetical protein
MADTVERGIYFYRTDATDQHGQKAVFDAKKVFAYLKALPFTDAGLYRDNGDGTTNAVWVEKLSPLLISYAIVRHQGLPTVERQGQLSPLPIRPKDGLCEPIHAVFFDNGIVGAEFNFHGPRLTGLASYLKEKAPANMMPEHLRFGMLLKTDPIAFLDRVDDLKVLDLKIKSVYLDELTHLDGANPFGAFGALQDFGEPDTVELVLKSGRKRGVGLSGKVTSFVRRMITKQKLGLTEAFKIGGTDSDTGRRVTFDLLKEHIVAQGQMLRLDERSRAIQPESAYRNIREAYDEIGRSVLERAPSA